MINIVGYFAGELGLGVVARNVARAVARLGAPPACSVALAGQGRDRAAPPFPTPSIGQIDLRFASTLLIAGAVPNDWMLGAAQFLRGKTRLAILAYWELTELPAPAVHFLDHADVLFAGSPFMVDVFRRYLPHKPCYELPCPLDLPTPAASVRRQSFGLPESIPLVLTSFEPLSDTRRKNCEGAVAAFMESAPDHDARLILKVNWPAAIPKDDEQPMFKGAREMIEAARCNPRLIVIEEALEYDRLLQLYSCADVVMSLHRAEGLGLVLLEALLLGKPVIATGWSGNLAFMNPTSASLVRYRLVPSSGLYGYYQASEYAKAPVWAEPDLKHAAELLTRTLTDPSFATRLRDEGGRTAQAYQQRARQADWLFHLQRQSAPAAAAAGADANAGSEDRVRKADRETQRQLEEAGTGAGVEHGKPRHEEFAALASLFSQERLSDAAALAGQLTRRCPSHPAGWMALAEALVRTDQIAEAVAPLQRAIELVPRDTDAHNDLGYAFSKLGRFDEAEACYQQVLQIDPENALGHNNLGNALLRRGRFDEAERCYRLALHFRADYADAHRNLGIALQDTGRIEEAEASYRRALQVNPEYVGAHNNLLLCLNCTDRSAAECLEDACRYGHLVAASVDRRFESWRCAMRPDQLRIGLVSGDLGEHAVGHFLEGLLANLDPSRVELYAYPTHDRDDELTARIRSRFACWRPLSGRTDEAAAHSIHADGVHILLELSGHTEFNRLPVFGWKPAPIQVSWLGHAATTGLAEIDYVIADRFTVPEGDEMQFTEKVWRLPETRLCFTPPNADLPVSGLPALTHRCLTFCCFNNISKINSAVVGLWARILAGTPGSRLYLKARQLSGHSVPESIVKRFADKGIGAHRLLLEGQSARGDYLAAYYRADIALDPFPYTGGTTTAEALWMGVPVLTLAGERLVSRQGVGLLINAGLPEWVAANADDYVDRAIRHASNLPRLSALRASLREQVLASPLFDAARFARHFENAAYRMWADWCSKNQ